MVKKEEQLYKSEGAIVSLKGLETLKIEKQEIKAVGKLVPNPGFYQINEVNEYKNYLELRFNSNGGEVTGSFIWRYGHKQPEFNFEEHHNVNLTGDYSGGKSGSFQGKFTGTISNTVNEELRGKYSGSINGSWVAEMDDKGHISGYFKYESPTEERAERLNFEATLE